MKLEYAVGGQALAEDIAEESNHVSSDAEDQNFRVGLALDAQQRR